MKKRSRSLCTLLLAALGLTTATAQWKSIGPVDRIVALESNSLTLKAGAAIVQVALLSPSVVRVRMNPSGVFASDHSWAVLQPPSSTPHVQFLESTASYDLSTPNLRVTITRNPLRIRITDSSGTIVAEDDPAKGMAWSGSEVRVWKTMPIDEHYYGLGEKAGLLDRRQTACTMWNSDIPAYTADTDPLYQSIPFFLAIRQGRAYGVFMDNTFRSSFDFGKESRNTYAFGAEAGDLNYYVFTGGNPEEILTNYTALLGRMPLPPLWSLGYQQCRWSYPTEKRVREIAEGFRSRAIPCDVIYLDIDYMDGYRIFTFNKKNFPDPTGMVRDLGAQGFKIAVIVDPGIKTDSSYNSFKTGLADNVFVHKPDGTLYTGKVWPGVCAFPDFTMEKARTWWGENFKVLVDAGIRGWWNDMNEPSVFDVPTKTIDLDVIHDSDHGKTTHAEMHNIYGMEMTRGTYDGVRKLLPGERPFVLTRASYAGGWRYSAAWTGDNVSSWEHLNLAVSMCLNLSISGQPFVGSDIGGFIGHPSGELFARWLELGVFTPLMRAHSVINEVNKEPWEYGDSITNVNRRTIELRYRFLPFIYSEMERASRTGVSPMRPMIFAYPGMDSFHGVTSQFMFGDNLLVAPVLDEFERTKEVLLPPGTWYDYWTDEATNGPARIRVDAPLDRLPLFVRAGTALPTRQVVQSTAQAPIDPLTITVYPDIKNGRGRTDYYEDDGHSFAYEKGSYLRREIEQYADSSQLRVVFSRTEGSYAPASRRLAVVLKNIPERPTSVKINGVGIFPGRIPHEELQGWSYESGSVMLWMNDTRDRIEITVSLARR